MNPYNGMPNWGNAGPGHRPPLPGRPSWGKSGACFYKEINFGGEYFRKNRGESYNNLPPGYNDRISAIRILGGAEVRFFNDSNYGGRRANTRRDIANLKNWRTADDPYTYLEQPDFFDPSAITEVGQGLFSSLPRGWHAGSPPSYPVTLETDRG